MPSNFTIRRCRESAANSGEGCGDGKARDVSPPSRAKLAISLCRSRNLLVAAPMTMGTTAVAFLAAIAAGPPSVMSSASPDSQDQFPADRLLPTIASTHPSGIRAACSRLAGHPGVPVAREIAISTLMREVARCGLQMSTDRAADLITVPTVALPEGQFDCNLLLRNGVPPGRIRDGRERPRGLGGNLGARRASRRTANARRTRAPHERA
jgi:hypothetical protein